MDKGLFFMTLSLCCMYLVIDSAFGKDMVGAFLKTVIPSLYE